jgi:general secretion pathway protein K
MSPKSSGRNCRSRENSPRLKAADRQHGFALIAVLWLLLLLGVIGGIVINEARNARRSSANEVSLVKARLLADSALNQIILDLIEPQGSAHWRLDGTPAQLHIFDRDLSARVESESGKIDLNAASRDLLSALFRGQGLGPAEAGDLADRVIAWRTPLKFTAPDATDDPYQDAHRTYMPRHAPFRSVAELRLVLGMTDELQEHVTPLITVYSRTPEVDRQIATDHVLSALSEAGDSLAESQLRARSLGAAAGVDRPPNVGEALTITARLEDPNNGISISRSAVIRLTGDARVPYWVLAWY